MTTTINDFIAHVYNNYCIIYHATILRKTRGPQFALGSPDPCNGHMVTWSIGPVCQELLTVLDGEKPTSKELPSGKCRSGGAGGIPRRGLGVL